MSDGQWKYDIALSFAGEQRGYVNEVASGLRDSGVKVFYDDYEKASLWGVDLYEHLAWVYEKAARYCVLFASAEYANKVWTTHERRNAQARAVESKAEYILPARFDDTEIPGLRSTVGYIDVHALKPDQLVDTIIQKLGPRESKSGFPQNVDRLYEAMGINAVDSKQKERRREVREVGVSVYEAFSRMTLEERTAVGGVLAFGCAAELPKGVHISLDLLSRMTSLPKAEIVDSLSAVRSLNFKTTLRDRPHGDSDGRAVLEAEDRDLFLSYWSSRAPQAEDATSIAYNTIGAAADHYCSEHGLAIIRNLDFHRLSRSERGPVMV